MMASDMLEAVKAERRPVLTPADADSRGGGGRPAARFHRHLVPYGDLTKEQQALISHFINAVPAPGGNIEAASLAPGTR